MSSRYRRRRYIILSSVKCLYTYANTDKVARKGDGGCWRRRNNDGGRWHSFVFTSDLKFPAEYPQRVLLSKKKKKNKNRKKHSAITRLSAVRGDYEGDDYHSVSYRRRQLSRVRVGGVLVKQYSIGGYNILHYNTIYIHIVLLNIYFIIGTAAAIAHDQQSRSHKYYYTDK